MRNVLVHRVRPIYLESLQIHTEHCGQQDNPNIHTTALIFLRLEGELYKVSISMWVFLMCCTDFLENVTNIIPINQKCV